MHFKTKLFIETIRTGAESENGVPQFETTRAHDVAILECAEYVPPILHQLTVISSNTTHPALSWVSSSTSSHSTNRVKALGPDDYGAAGGPRSSAVMPDGWVFISQVRTICSLPAIQPSANAIIY